MIKNDIIQKIDKILLALFLFTAMILGDAMLSSTDEISFRCKVKNEYHLTDDGKLVKPELYYYTGSPFSVEKSTGRIIGGAFENQSDYQVKVVEGHSFKVFSFAEKRGVAESVAIRTWQKGEQKPFIGIDYLQTVVTGTCD